MPNSPKNAAKNERKIDSVSSVTKNDATSKHSAATTINPGRYFFMLIFVPGYIVTVQSL
jgi:hypothetical protein